MELQGGYSIAAIATAPGRGGIGIVRVSGNGLLDVAVKLTGRRPEPRRATSADFLDREGKPIDRGILIFFPAPNSFTGEDVLEMQGHGGPIIIQMILSRCLELGARLAEPGEFTRRAFLNDKMDLAQAEAVADLIDATTAAAARSAYRSLSGDFSRQVRSLVARLIELRMLIEATLDFPEEEIDVIRNTDAAARLEAVCTDLSTLRERAREGRLLRAGMHIVLAGLPNVGKSSLMNQLAGEERAIVTDIAGTTRDAVRETIQLEGIPLHIVDTAGLRETDDVVEQVGIARAWKEIENADVILQMVDSRTGVTPSDKAIADRLPRAVERLIIENKCDLAGQTPSRQVAADGVHVCLSAKNGEGVDLLREELLRVAGWGGHGEDVILARERHLEALAIAADKTTLALLCLAQVELCAEELRLAQEALSAITGEFSADDLLGEIFSRFCIGK